MDSAHDYNSLLKRYNRIRSELDETAISLKKFCSYEDKSRYLIPSGQRKQIFMPERNVLEASSPKPIQVSSKQNDLICLSESEESESDDDHPSKKFALQSAVIARVGSSRTRKKFISTNNSDNIVQLRHRRFLGMVQSTLQKFQDEEVKRQPQDLKRRKALEKVEAAAAEEEKNLRRQREELLFKSKQQHLEIECLEKMMRISESFELWKNNQRHLLNYIATKTEPVIFFLPTISSTSSNKQLEKSRMEIEAKIEKQKMLVEAVLSRIKHSYGISISDSTEETPLFETDNSKNVLNPEITSEETKDTEETLYLDISEDEAEDFIKMSY